ncbi:uncharacterized protein LOC126823445 [Patella vulgata]|uniref:uncharacterized protein LOC126823445 n=1 Tax=Patella vulgata TaxID=6465 RepID=UPI0021806A92|nr:uncharacterized protein LOC126823445 [Patella vulgata]
MAKIGFIFIISLVMGTVCGYRSNQNFSQPEVITTPNFPLPYPSDASLSWAWSKPTGRWAVLFEEFDIHCMDTLYLKDDSAGKQLPFDCNQKLTKTRAYYTKGSSLIIRFTSSHESEARKGFKIRVLYGRDKDDLKSQVYELKNGNKDGDGDHVYTLLYVMLALVVLIIVGMVVSVIIIKRRKRPGNQTVTVSVATNHVRKGSGVSYKRSASTSDSMDTTTTTTEVEICRSKVQRTPSQRSWTTRATLTNTQNGVVDNVYSPMENMAHYQNQINRPLSPVLEYDPLSKPVPSSVRHPTTISGYESPVINVSK